MGPALAHYVRHGQAKAGSRMVGMQLNRLPVERFLRGMGPVVDVRAPAEFAQGHIPGARNLPLFSDEQRAAVGTTYKHQGRQAAVQLGLELVGPRLGELGRQLSAWADEAGGSPLRLHCWRGGMRSESVAWLATQLDRPVVLLEGGYKSFRRWALALFETPWPIHLMGGRTGSGKTDLLLALADRQVAVVDLEGLAHHRGSSFGSLGMPPQPSSEHYENRIALALHRYREAEQIWVEAESVQVGRCRIPGGFWRQMQAAPLLEIRRPLEERTAAALVAIEQHQWGEAARQMLDYYDRCYDHELQRHGSTDQQRLLGHEDLAGLSPETAADQLISRGVIKAQRRNAA